ncbi:MAG: hypothetical protein PHO70_03250 [Candidatus Omnitrophica bacterium]|nr:hypothetical protein [Candidatus Omnitrophota bacterium]
MKSRDVIIGVITVTLLILFILGLSINKKKPVSVNIRSMQQDKSIENLNNTIKPPLSNEEPLRPLPREQPFIKDVLDI